MGGRSGDMGNSSRAGASQKLRRGLMGTGEHQRCARKCGAQKNLQSTVAADVVKSAPGYPGCRRFTLLDGASQTGEGVDHQLGPSRWSRK